MSLYIAASARGALLESTWGAHASGSERPYVQLRLETLFLADSNCKELQMLQ